MNYANNLDNNPLTMEINTTRLKYTLCSFIITNALTSFASMIYVLVSKNFKSVMREILICEGVIMCLSSTSMLFGFLLLEWLNAPNVISCGLLYDLIPLTTLLIGCYSTLLSNQDLNSSKLLKNESSHVFWILITSFMLFLLSVIFCLTMNTHFIIFNSNCGSNENLFWIFVGFSLAFIIIMIIITSVKVKKAVRKPTFQNNIIIIKVNDESLPIDQEHSATEKIPSQVSILKSLLMLSMFSTLVMLYITGFLMEEEYQWLCPWIEVLIVMCNGLHYPIVIVSSKISNKISNEFSNDNHYSSYYYDENGQMESRYTRRFSITSLVSLSAVEILAMQLKIDTGIVTPPITPTKNPPSL